MDLHQLPTEAEGYLVFKERVAGREKSEPSTIRGSVARFWGTKRVFSGIYGDKKIFVVSWAVIWITDGRFGGVGGECGRGHLASSARIHFPSQAAIRNSHHAN